MNIEGRGVYELTTISVRWLPVSAIQFLSENNLIKLITHIYEFTGGVTRNIKRGQDSLKTDQRQLIAPSQNPSCIRPCLNNFPRKHEVIYTKEDNFV